MPRSVSVTVDYEVFGNGSGDIRQHVTDPTERMCQIAERYGVPITVFFEIEEFLQFEKHAPELRDALGYDPADEMRRQAADLSGRGHDVQLHIHPQWHRARFDGSQWQLNQDCLTVDSLFETEEETTEFIRQRRPALEGIPANQ